MGSLTGGPFVGHKGGSVCISLTIVGVGVGVGVAMCVCVPSSVDHLLDVGRECAYFLTGYMTTCGS